MTVTELSSTITKQLKIFGFTVHFLQFFFSASNLYFQSLRSSSISCCLQSKLLFSAFFGAVVVARCMPGVGVKTDASVAVTGIH